MKKVFQSKMWISFTITSIITLLTGWLVVKRLKRKQLENEYF